MFNKRWAYVCCVQIEIPSCLPNSYLIQGHTQSGNFRNPCTYKYYSKPHVNNLMRSQLTTLLTNPWCNWIMWWADLHVFWQAIWGCGTWCTCHQLCIILSHIYLLHCYLWLTEWRQCTNMFINHMVSRSHITGHSFVVNFGGGQWGEQIIASDFICLYIFIYKKKVCNAWPGSQTPYTRGGRTWQR